MAQNRTVLETMSEEKAQADAIDDSAKTETANEQNETTEISKLTETNVSLDNPPREIIERVEVGDLLVEKVTTLNN